MVFAVVRIFPLARQKAQVRDILGSVRDLAQTQSSCLGCWLDDGGYLNGPVTYLEQWESEEALSRHLRSDLYSRVLVALELSAEVPEVEFFSVARTRGIEWINAIRRVTEPQPAVQG